MAVLSYSKKDRYKIWYRLRCRTILKKGAIILTPSLYQHVGIDTWCIIITNIDLTKIFINFENGFLENVHHCVKCVWLLTWILSHLNYEICKLKGNDMIRTVSLEKDIMTTIINQWWLKDQSIISKWTKIQLIFYFWRKKNHLNLYQYQYVGVDTWCIIIPIFI